MQACPGTPSPSYEVGSECLPLGLQMKSESERQEAAVHATMEEDEAVHGKVTRTISSVRLFVDAARADEQVRCSGCRAWENRGSKHDMLLCRRGVLRE